MTLQRRGQAEEASAELERAAAIHRQAQGAAHWERYLARNPKARDAERVKSQLTEIRRAIASLN